MGRKGQGRRKSNLEAGKRIYTKKPEGSKGPWTDMSFWDFCACKAPGSVYTFPEGEADVNFDVIEEKLNTFRYPDYRSDEYVSLAAARLILENIFPPDFMTSGVIRLEPEELERLRTCKICLDDPPGSFDLFARRPYYRMRGIPVSEEQAFEIIRKTDEYISYLFWKFPCLTKNREAHLVETGHFMNWWFNKNHYPAQYGWAHPSGVIGINSITGKYPTFLELLDELLRYHRAFPFLDFVTAFTHWDEYPISAQTATGYMDETPGLYPDFLENVICGVWLHDNAIEFLGKDRAVEKYTEYDKLYSHPDFRVYVPKSPVGKGFYDYPDYLRRCIASFGINPDTVLE